MANQEFYYEQFKALKAEELARIGFRDNMIYITLVAIGACFSFCLEKPQYNFGLLVLPFFCGIIGWTYFNNDRKVSMIGVYIDTYVIPNMKAEDKVYRWAEFRKQGKGRMTRKLVQLLVNIFLFCLSSVVSIGAFYFTAGNVNLVYHLVASLELIFLLGLMLLFIRIYKN